MYRLVPKTGWQDDATKIILRFDQINGKSSCWTGWLMLRGFCLFASFGFLPQDDAAISESSFRCNSMDLPDFRSTGWFWDCCRCPLRALAIILWHRMILVGRISIILCLGTSLQCIVDYKAQLLIGDFNQAAPHMASELKTRFGLEVHADSHHPEYEDCICIFGIGSKAPGHDSDISVWRHLNGAHWPLARHYGSKPKRTDAGAENRKRKSLERWAASKAKAKANVTHARTPSASSANLTSSVGRLPPANFCSPPAMSRNSVSTASAWPWSADSTSNARCWSQYACETPHFEIISRTDTLSESNVSRFQILDFIRFHISDSSFHFRFHISDFRFQNSDFRF